MVQADAGTRLSGRREPETQVLHRFFPGESPSPNAVMGSQPNPAQIVRPASDVCASAQPAGKTVPPVRPVTNPPQSADTEHRSEIGETAGTGWKQDHAVPSSVARPAGMQMHAALTGKSGCRFVPQNNLKHRRGAGCGSAAQQTSGLFNTEHGTGRKASQARDRKNTGCQCQLPRPDTFQIGIGSGTAVNKPGCR